MTKRDIYGILTILTAFVGISICFLIERRFYHVISVYGTIESTKFIFILTMALLSAFFYMFIRSFKLGSSARVLSYFVSLSPLGLALFPLDGGGLILTVHWMFGIILFFGTPLVLLMTNKNIKVMKVNIEGVLYVSYVILYLILFYRGQFLQAQFLGVIYSGILILQILVPHPLKFYGILQTDKTDAS
jgi:hypothetical protein